MEGNSDLCEESPRSALSIPLSIWFYVKNILCLCVENIFQVSYNLWSDFLSVVHNLNSSVKTNEDLIQENLSHQSKLKWLSSPARKLSHVTLQQHNPVTQS